jgi:hypothetical protein
LTDSQLRLWLPFQRHGVQPVVNASHDESDPIRRQRLSGVEPVSSGQVGAQDQGREQDGKNDARRLQLGESSGISGFGSTSIRKGEEPPGRNLRILIVPKTGVNPSESERGKQRIDVGQRPLHASAFLGAETVEGPARAAGDS